MKTYLCYGAAMAGVNMLHMFALYFLNIHSDPEKMAAAGVIPLCIMLLIATTFLVLGTRARRAEVPLAEEFGYGRALGAAMMVSLFAALLGIVINFVYAQFINPEFGEVTLRMQTTAMEAKGMSATQIENMQKFSRMGLTPVGRTIGGFIFSIVICTLISLITSIFLRRPAAEYPLVQPPSAAA